MAFRLPEARSSSPASTGRPYVLVLLATALLVGGTVWTWRATDLSLGDLAPLPALAILLVLAPATLLVNALEHREIARGLGHRITPSSATRVTVIATAANLAPAPGAVITRAADLKRRGSAAREIGAGLASAGALWVAAATGAAAVVLAFRGETAAAGVAGVASIGAAAAGVLLGRGAGFTAETMVRLLAVEVLTIPIGAARLALGMRVLGEALPIADAFVLAAAPTLAAAAGVVPGGIGLAEGLTALIAPLVEAAPAVAFAAVALNRVLGLIVTAVAGLIVGRRDPAEASATDVDPREPS